MNTMALTQATRSRSERGVLWIGALLTATAAVLFPRLNAVLHNGQALWELDPEAAILIPVVVAGTLALFALVGGWAWRDESSHNRPAKVALACGLLAPVGVLAFFVSAPIILGGLAVTLGIEGIRRAELEGRRLRAAAAVALGSVAALAGATIWLVNF
jgi:hypothetical protein